MKITKDELKAKIIAGIFENHAGKITGSVLQTILLDMVDSLSGDSTQPGTPVFEISDFLVSPLKLTSGTEITISGKITNTGTAAGTITVKIELINNTNVVVLKNITTPTIQPGGVYNLLEKLATTGIGNGTYSIVVTAPGISKTQNIVIAPADIFQVTGIVYIQKSAITKPVPVEGARIQIKGTTSVATSDANGKYLTLPETSQPVNNGTLILSYKNIVVKEEPVDNRSVVNFTFSSSVNSILDTIKDKIQELIKLKDSSFPVFEKYPNLNEYLKNAMKFLENLNGISREKLATGKMNDEILAQFQAVSEPIIKVVLDLIKSGATPQKDQQLAVALKILDTNTTVFLGAIAETDVDLTSGSATYKYIGTQLKTLVKLVDKVGKEIILSEFSTITELAADKPLLSKLLTTLR